MISFTPRRGMPRSLSALVAFAALLCATACRSPLVSSGDGIQRADVSMTLIVSGNSVAAAGYGGTAASPKLLLPTATTLSVSLVASDGSAEAIVKTTPISGTSAEITFEDVPVRSYDVLVEASAGGKVLFRAVSSIDVGESSPEFVVALVPTDSVLVETVGEYSVSVAAIARGDSKTLKLIAGSRLLAGSSLFLFGMDPGCHVFLQGLDGVMLAQGKGVSRLSLAGVSVGSDCYITFYAELGDQPALSAYAGPIMVGVQAGTFQREAEPTSLSAVSPFSLGMYEVTRAQFQAVMGTDPSDLDVSPGMDNPIQNASWYAAIAFCNKLSLMEGLSPVYSVSGVDFSSLAYGDIPTAADPVWDAVIATWSANGYRLPIEAEWSWAAMGANADARSGDVSGLVNIGGYTKGYAGSVEAADAQVGRADYAQCAPEGATAAVGSKLPNELGLFDMTGNVNELCWDRYNGDGLGAVYADPIAGLSVSDYKGYTVTPHDEVRVTRGGSYGSNLAGLALAQRSYGAFSYQQSTGNGFRVALGTLPAYTVSYDANGASMGEAPAASTHSSGDLISLPGYACGLVGSPIKDGISQRIIGWNAKADGSGVSYALGSTISVRGDLRLYAQYTTDSSAIGKIGPAGGYVFYDNGYVLNGWQYLEAAAEDQCVPSDGVPWDNTPSRYVFNARNNAIGTGSTNTAAIIAIQGTATMYAARACVLYQGGGKSDWFLPSLGDLEAMRTNLYLAGIAEFGDAYYWSSSEDSDNIAYAQDVTNAAVVQATASKQTSGYYVRAARSFCPASPTKAIFSTPGIYSLSVPSSATTITVKAWGGGGGGANNYSLNYDTAGGAGGFVYSTNEASSAVALAVSVGAAGGMTGAITAGIPAPGGRAMGAAGKGGDGSVVAIDNGTSFTLLACAGGGGGAGAGTYGNGSGGRNGLYATPAGTAGSQCGGGGAGLGGMNTPWNRNGTDWIPGTATFAGFGGIGGSSDGSWGGSGGGGYGGGSGGGDGSTKYAAGGGGSFATGIGSYFTEGLSSGGHDSTADPDYASGVGVGGPTTGNQLGGNGRVVITITY